MRFLSALTNDIRYQIKYGFYLLYALISAIYIAILSITPIEYKKTIASVIVLIDPAMLGMFFIGGIWLLEKEEGLHRYWNISPLKGVEYIIAKAISLSMISTISAGLIILIGIGKSVDYLVLLASILIGSFIFTTLGLVVASYSRSVNNYILIGTPTAVLLSAPSILAAFGFSHQVLEILPGTALWRVIACSIGLTDYNSIWLWILLALWLGIAVLLANKRIPYALQKEDGGKI